MNKEKKCFEADWEKEAAVGMWINIVNRISNLENRKVHEWKKEFIRKWNDIHNDEAQIAWKSDCPFCSAYSGDCYECPLSRCTDSESLWDKVVRGKQNEALEAVHTILGHIFAMSVEPNKCTVWFDKSLMEMTVINRSICSLGDEYVELYSGSYKECCKWREEHKKFLPVMAAYYCDNKLIEHRLSYHFTWYDCSSPSWKVECEYRVKPEASKKSGSRDKQKRRWTNRELAKWLADSKGQFSMNNGVSAAIDFTYPTQEDNKPVPYSYKIRPWDSDEWHEPEVEE